MIPSWPPPTAEIETFLRARIVEELADVDRVMREAERTGQEPDESVWMPGEANGTPVIAMTPLRARQEVETRQRLLAVDTCLACDVEHQPCNARIDMLLLLVQPYSWHPLFDPSWLVDP